MNFFEHQEQARRKTTLLVTLFIATLLGLIALVYGLCIVAFGREDLWQPDLLFMVSVGIGGTVLISSTTKTVALRFGGGSAVAESLGGTRVHSNSNDLAERRLLNVVEEMAIASGIAAPPVYVMTDEEGINAFAAGWSPNEAAIGVTRGTLETLTRDELQGVIAHEFSHILNGDMRLNTRLLGVLHGIMVISIVGRFLMRGASYRPSRKRGEGAGLMFLGLGLYAVGLLGVLCGKLVRASVSRQREFLADASAVQFTRNPQGIGGALVKIGGFSAGSHVQHPAADEASHMFFGNALHGLLSRGFATHPPLSERIQRILPSWQGTFPHQVHAELPAFASEPPTSAMMAAPPASASQTHTPQHALSGAFDSMGAPTPAHLQYARDLLATIPAQLQEASREPYSARALVYALLLSHDVRLCAAQLESLARSGEAGMEPLVQQLHSDVKLLDARARLPLLDVTLPALCELSREQFRIFQAQVVNLVQADNRVAVFEWTLISVLRRHLAPHFEPKKPAPRHHKTLNAVAEDCAVLLSAVARAGQHAHDDVLRAFARGAATTGLSGLQLKSEPDCELDRLDQALTALTQTSATARLQFLQAASACATSDGRITIREAELVRAIADSLECPLPPLLPD